MTDAVYQFSAVFKPKMVEVQRDDYIYIERQRECFYEDTTLSEVVKHLSFDDLQRLTNREID